MVVKSSVIAAVVALALIGSGSADAKGTGSHHSPRAKAAGTGSHSGSTSSTTRHSSTRSTTAKRDSHGRIARSEEAKHQFEVKSGYPHGRPGYVVDHIVPLACGGADAPSNMQWQTTAAAAAKDKVERKGC